MDAIFKKAPRIGMGCWAIGGEFWAGDVPVGYSGTTDTDSLAAIDAAWAAGVRVFDTSAVYGTGHSETLLGQALGNRSDAILVTKFGHVFDAEKKQIIGAQYDPAYIKDSISQSLKRLQRDQIDVILLHLNDLEIEEAKPIFDTLEALQSSGQVASFGWSTDFPDRLDALAPRAGFTTVQHAMNIFFDAPSLSAVAQNHDLVQLIRSPLAMGLLTGKFSGGQRIGTSDVRGNNAEWHDYFTDGAINPTYAKQIESIRDLITVGGRSLTQGALCWLLAKSANTVPLPGAKNAAQAEENAGAMAFGPLPEKVMAEIEDVLQRPPEGPARER